jgi:hypothetical protein
MPMACGLQLGNATLDLTHAFSLGQVANDEKARFTWEIPAVADSDGLKTYCHGRRVRNVGT